MITLLVPGALRAEAGGASQLSVAAAGTLSAVFDEVAERWPRLARRICDEQGQLRRYVNAYIDGEECPALSGLATHVEDRTAIQVLPSVVGG
jgi:molybdopterin converting factor small subunit